MTYKGKDVARLCDDKSADSPADLSPKTSAAAAGNIVNTKRDALDPNPVGSLFFLQAACRFIDRHVETLTIAVEGMEPSSVAELKFKLRPVPLE